MPTVDAVKKKTHELERSKNVTLKEEDIDQVCVCVCVCMKSKL